MAFKLIFLLVALLAVQGLVSGSPLKRNKDVVAAATESDGEGGLEMYGARNESERHARSAGVSDDMLSLIMAQAYIESSENDDLAFAQEVPCRKEAGFQMTDRILKNIANTGGEFFKQKFVSTTYATVSYRAGKPTLGNLVFESDYNCDAEEHLMNDYLDTLKPKEYPAEIWLSQSPCWRKCANSLMAYFKGEPKPTIYFNHLWVGEEQFREREINCMALMKKKGFGIEIWDWFKFQLRMTNDKCYKDIELLILDQKYQKRMAKLQQTIDLIEHKSEGNPKCPKDQERVKDCHAVQHHNNNNYNNYDNYNQNNYDNYNQNNYDDDYYNNNNNNNKAKKGKGKKGNKKNNHNYNNNGNGYHPNEGNHPNQVYHPKANNGNGNHLDNHVYKHDTYWNPKRQ